MLAIRLSSPTTQQCFIFVIDILGKPTSLVESTLRLEISRVDIAVKCVHLWILPIVRDGGLVRQLCSRL